MRIEEYDYELKTRVIADDGNEYVIVVKINSDFESSQTVVNIKTGEDITQSDPAKASKIILDMYKVSRNKMNEKEGTKLLKGLKKKILGGG